MRYVHLVKSSCFLARPHVNFGISSSLAYITWTRDDEGKRPRQVSASLRKLSHPLLSKLKQTVV